MHHQSGLEASLKQATDRLAAAEARHAQEVAGLKASAAEEVERVRAALVAQLVEAQRRGGEADALAAAQLADLKARLEAEKVRGTYLTAFLWRNG